MLRHLPALIFAACFAPLLQGQDYFQKVYAFPPAPSFFLDISPLPDGNMAILSDARIQPDGAMHSHLWLLDEQGEVIWSEALIVGKSSRGAALALAPDGNLIVALNATDAADSLLPTLLKIDLGSGAVLWESHFILPTFTQIVQTIAVTGGYAVLATHTGAPSIGVSGITVIFKIAENGDLLWEKTWADEQKISCRDLAVNSLGELYLAGQMKPLSLESQAILIKMSADGNLLWSKIYDGVYAREIHLDASDHIWLGGASRLPDQQIRSWIQQSNGDGDIIWSKVYATEPSQDIYLSDLSGLPNGDVVITGYDRLIGASNTILARLSATGALVWAKKYANTGQNDYLLAVAPTNSGDLLAGGLTGEGLDKLAAWVVKTDLAGNIPTCCVADFSFSPRDIAPVVSPYNVLTTSTLEISAGMTTVQISSPVVRTICGASATTGSANAFTPDGDQINDRFLPQFACPPETLRFEVYNRWGQLVFNTSDPATLGWDGEVDGQPAPTEAYVWLLEYETFINGSLEKKQDQGEVTLLR